jgi:hypothetical protein
MTTRDAPGSTHPATDAFFDKQCTLLLRVRNYAVE